ncbi:MAG: hypothetical protein N4A33_01270 [Bacteriovoracaceae bacterium]|jgi:hypothetical protein|nr:hypothetical protein [Bacteriovoracaceae bacterium]
MKLGKILLLISAFAVTSCGLFGDGKRKGASLIVNKDATLHLPSTKEEVKKDEAVDLPTESFLVRSPGHIPVYVIPLNSTFREAKVNLSEFEASELSQTFQSSVQSSLSDSLFEVHEIQNEIFKKQFDRALNLIGSAESKYGALPFLSYMKASVYYLKGDAPRAKQILQIVIDKGNASEKIKAFIKEI